MPSILRYAVMSVRDALQDQERKPLEGFAVNGKTVACILDRTTGNVIALCTSDVAAWKICQALNVTEGA